MDTPLHVTVITYLQCLLDERKVYVYFRPILLLTCWDAGTLADPEGHHARCRDNKCLARSSTRKE